MASTSTSIATLTAAELEQARACLCQAETGLIGATKGLSETQWTFKPGADRWSIAEIVEHLAKVNELILGPIRERLAQAPPPPADASRLDQLIISQFPVRLNRFSGPEMLHPSGSSTPAESLARFQEGSRALAEHVGTTPGLRQHAIPSMPLKAITGGAYELMDGYQWVLGAAAHTERHIRQILEVKADPNFPA